MPTIGEQFDRKWLTKEDRPRFAEVPDRRVAEYWYHAGAAAEQERVLAIIATATRVLIAVPDTGDYIKGVFALQEAITGRICQRGEEGK